MVSGSRGSFSWKTWRGRDWEERLVRLYTHQDRADARWLVRLAHVGFLHCMMGYVFLNMRFRECRSYCEVETLKPRKKDSLTFLTTQKTMHVYVIVYIYLVCSEKYTTQTGHRLISYTYRTCSILPSWSGSGSCFETTPVPFSNNIYTQHNSSHVWLNYGLYCTQIQNTIFFVTA